MSNSQCSYSGCSKEDEFSKKLGKCIFHCEKDDWYMENSDGKKKWDEDLVRKFWKELREEITFEDYKKNLGYKEIINLQYFIFPKFEEKTTEFRQNLNFHISRYVNQTIKSEFVFKNTTFLDKVDFNDFHFFEEVSFYKSIFKGEASFNNARFEKVAYFSEAKFHKQVDFSRAKFSEEKQTLFDGTEFLANDNLKEEERFLEPAAKFQNVIFPSPVVFRGCDLSYVSFLNARVENVYFDECSFLIAQEKRSKKIWQKIFAFDKHYILFEEKDKNKTIKKIKSLETLYRRFKKNFDEKKDYHMADDFYGGEMEMKLEYLKKEYDEKKSASKMASMQFLKAYKYISDYNGNPILPLVWILILALLSSITFLIYNILPNIFSHSKFLIIISMFTLVFFSFKTLGNQKKYPHGENNILNVFSWVLMPIGLFFTFIILSPAIYLTSLSKSKNRIMKYAFFSIFILILLFLVITNNPIFTSFQWGFTAAIPLPLIKFPGENLSRFEIMILYTENIISVPLWALFILSLRRKFKR